VENRVVHLSGTVGSEAAKAAAARVARLVEGVVDVQNDLNVKAE
jgi:osmotically-inducible protein OsmY